MDNIVFQVVGAVDAASVVTETILAAVALGVLVSLINMGGARD
jgi:hypothetical protein